MMQGKFYCTTRALNSSERAHHKLLTDKLATERTQIVETEKGYEFQYSPFTVSHAELADWVVAESKCCPFFGFHIDQENEGKLLYFRLTGEEGIKTFVGRNFWCRRNPDGKPVSQQALVNGGRIAGFVFRDLKTEELLNRGQSVRLGGRDHNSTPCWR
jgi:hypothetical protein